MKNLEGYWRRASPKAVRPLGEISNFVQEELPRLISNFENVANNNSDPKINYALAERMKELFTQDAAEIIKGLNDNESFNVAILDCKMCAMALWHGGIQELPQNLKELLVNLCKQRGDPHILTYEDIILNNPPSDLRTFFEKKSALADNEIVFYTAHQMVENFLIPAVAIIRSALAQEKISEFETSAIAVLLKGSNQATALLSKELIKKDFGVFRKYLKSVGPLNGPSGAFSGSYPLLDLLWLGKDKVFDDNLKRYQNDMIYFPSFQREEIKHLATTDSVSVKCLVTSGNTNFNNLLKVIEKAMFDFRAIHLGSVKKHLPEVFADQEQGTGNVANPGTYLKNSLNHTKKSS